MKLTEGVVYVSKSKWAILTLFFASMIVVATQKVDMGDVLFVGVMLLIVGFFEYMGDGEVEE
ncbi:hypothetical protein SN16_11125 [Salinicoccus roseus]|uniref:Uncharacterized protein n=1 Tax=Salinicoccus roseus TaxID=45670 RepID=A0A0C2HKD3_9STAP|nr:hypothetical protein SN16_11125 [Salinicoccus roseus]